MDRLWSLLPAFYVSFFAVLPHLLNAQPWDARLVLMQTLVTLWGIRLTYNFARKGGYQLSSEDYRWPVMRKRLTRVQFELLNVVFIAFYQNLLLLQLTLPAYVAWRARGTPLNSVDFLAAALFLTLLVGEVIADEQQVCILGECKFVLLFFLEEILFQLPSHVFKWFVDYTVCSGHSKHASTI